MPAVWIIRLRVRRAHALPHFVGRGVEDFVLLKLRRDLAGASTLHAEREDPPDHLRRFLVDDPLLRVVRILCVPVGDVDGQLLAAFVLRLDDRTDFPAGILAEKLVKPVFQTGEVVVNAVGVYGVVVIVDGDEADAMLGKSEVDVHTCHGGVP